MAHNNNLMHNATTFHEPAGCTTDALDRSCIVALALDDLHFVLHRSLRPRAVSSSKLVCHGGKEPLANHPNPAGQETTQTHEQRPVLDHAVRQGTANNLLFDYGTRNTFNAMDSTGSMQTLTPSHPSSRLGRKLPRNDILNFMHVH